MPSDASREAVAAAVAQIPSGLAILTAAHEGRSTGMLASWIQQASFDPLMLTVCVKRDRPIEPLIDAAGRFVLNILGEGSTEMLKHFGRGFALGDDAFAGLRVHLRDYGIQLDGCLAHIACEVSAKVPAGDHFLYLARTVAGETQARARPHVHLRTTAVGY